MTQPSSSERTYDVGEKVWLKTSSSLYDYAAKQSDDLHIELAAALLFLARNGSDRVEAEIRHVNVPLNADGYAHYNIACRALNATRPADEIGVEQVDLEPMDA